MADRLRPDTEPAKVRPGHTLIINGLRVLRGRLLGSKRDRCDKNVIELVPCSVERDRVESELDGFEDMLTQRPRDGGSGGISNRLVLAGRSLLILSSVY
jgi:hypothetical protein